MRRRGFATGIVGVLIVVTALVMLSEIGRGWTVHPTTPTRSTHGDAVPDLATAMPTRANPTPQTASIYVVQPGDTLFRISVKLGVPLDALAKTNQISDPTKIYAGQKLTIPGTPVQPTVTIPASSVTPPLSVNGVSVERFVAMSDAVKQNIRQIYARGQSLGNNPRAFSKIGDSTVVNPLFLTRFDGGFYNLGNYAYLQSTIDYFAGSFGRESMAVRKGLHAWSMLNPTWADKAMCQPNETPVGCEFRLHKPSLALIRLGSNDSGAPKLFQENMSKLVEFCIQSGVIPILGTKADRSEGPGNINNNIIRQIAAQKNIPLWDFDLLASTLPGRGLEQDGVHLTAFYAHDYTLPEAFQRGHGVHNLSALIALDRVWREARAFPK